MRKLGIAAALAACLLASACRTETQYGACIGLNDTPDPRLVYKASTRNIVLAVLFVETIFVPVIVALNEHLCPVGVKATPVEAPK